MKSVGRTILRTYSSAVYAFLYAPILVLVVYSFNQSLQTARWLGFTPRWYAQVLRDRELIESAGNSLLVAAVTTVAATIIGTLAGLGLSRLQANRGSATKALLFLPIVIPEIVVGAALFTFFVAVEWELGFWSVVVAHISFSVSYVAIVVRARLAGFDRTLEEAARDLGAGPLGVFWRVKFPLMLPGIVAGALLVFTLSIDDYVITSFVAGVKTLPLHIYAKLKVNATPETNAISTLLLAVTIALITAAQWLLRSPRGRKK
ncbi:MAG: binding-protein-dependent transport system inner rane component [Phycisphaerales bacterium]|nr:binding-protein-dependent transport system inner rane component [Phycisphaerales bacterium]